MLLAERIAHERELRESERTAFGHEREMRATFDIHERELREKNEASVAKALDLQFSEYQRRLGDLNHAHELERQRNAESVTRIEWQQFKDDLSERTDLAAKEQATKHEQVLDSVRVLGDRMEGRLKEEVSRLNTAGPAAYRETEAARIGQETATTQILTTTRENTKETGIQRRWLWGIVVIVILGILANGITLLALLLEVTHVI